MTHPFTFAGKSSFIGTATTPEDLEAVVRLISEVKKLYFDSFKGIPYVINQPGSMHYPKFTLNETEEPPSISIDVKFDTLQVKLTDKVRKAFENLEEKLLETSKRVHILENIRFNYTGGITGEFLQLSTSIFLSPGYYVCPKCDRYTDDTKDNHIKWDDETIVMCQQSFNHGDVYFTDSVIGKSISDWQVPKYELGEGLTIYQLDNDSMQHRRLARELSMHAKLEENCFKSINYVPSDETIVYILAKEGIPIGYAYWNNSGINATERVLRQLFVMPSYRGGTGKKLMKATVDLEAPGNKRFIVESPNYISTQMLISLGYAKLKNKRVEGIKCTFTQGT